MRHSAGRSEERFYIDASTVFASLHELFSPQWRRVDETDLWYVFHVNGTYWARFLSHHVIYQRLP